MPEIEYKGKVLEVRAGENLRKALLQNGLSPYNGMAEHLNCRGIGTCGTCCVVLDVDVGPLTAIEKWRLQFPPHKGEAGKRLACQVAVTKDLRVSKGQGFWGQDVGGS